MLARNERSNALLHKICQRNMRGRFRRLSVIGKSGRDADLGKTTLLTDAVEKGLVIFGEQSRPQESEQDDKWSFCLTAGTLCPANQERQ
jgi:hypothetical protein